MTWLTDLMEMTKELESPTSFWYWSALAAISAVVKDNIWLNRGQAYKLYPNIYVMLFAKSGLRKGPPINLAKELVKAVNNTRIISGRSTIQGIMKELGTSQTVPGGKVNTSSNAFIVASEIASSLVEDRAAMTILTDLYDRHYNTGDWRNLLKMDITNLKSPTITMLGGINEPHFRDFISEKDVLGGYIGRNFVIAEYRKRLSNSLIDDIINPPDITKLAPHLKEISKLRGEFTTLSKTAAGRLFHEWYTTLDRTIEEQDIEDKTGTLDRIGDSVLKVAMLLSLAESTSLTISLENMMEAIADCERLIGNIRKTTMGKTGGDATIARNKTLIIQELMKRDNHMISKAQLLKTYWMHWNPVQLDELMDSFMQSGVVVPEMHGNVLVYVMPDKYVQEFKNFLAGKNEVKK